MAVESSKYDNLEITASFTSVVTLAFVPRSRNINQVTPRYEMHISTKYEVNPPNGLGGDREHTQTDTESLPVSILLIPVATLCMCV